jgi:hypothetical protein
VASFWLLSNSVFPAVIASCLLALQEAIVCSVACDVVDGFFGRGSTPERNSGTQGLSHHFVS